MCRVWIEIPQKYCIFCTILNTGIFRIAHQGLHNAPNFDFVVVLAFFGHTEFAIWTNDNKCFYRLHGFTLHFTLIDSFFLIIFWFGTCIQIKIRAIFFHWCFLLLNSTKFCQWLIYNRLHIVTTTEFKAIEVSHVSVKVSLNIWIRIHFRLIGSEHFIFNRFREHQFAFFASLSKWACRNRF